MKPKKKHLREVHGMTAEEYIQRLASRGGKARAKRLTREERVEIARQGGKAKAKARKESR